MKTLKTIFFTIFILFSFVFVHFISSPVLPNSLQTTYTQKYNAYLIASNYSDSHKNKKAYLNCDRSSECTTYRETVYFNAFPKLPTVAQNLQASLDKEFAKELKQCGSYACPTSKRK